MTAAQVIPLSNKRDWKWHRDRIASAWGKQIESIIETGQCLINAKEDPGVPHGSFEAMVQSKLPFGPRTAQRLMKIAENSTLVNATHVSHLPASWGTLYELTKLPNDILLAKLKDGSIHPKLERKDVRAMRPDIKAKPKAATREDVIAAIQREPTANQRDAAKELGISLGAYQRTRNELIGSGEIKGMLTLDDLRERMADLLRSLPKEERMREITRTMKAVGLNIHDWVSTMTIGRKGS
jgi:hypothetical protein